MQRRDHHDWASETYVEEWVRRQQAEDPSRAERFQLMCDLLPFPRDAATRISNYPWSAPYEDVKVKGK